MAGFLNGIANFAANGGAFFAPSLLLNSGVPPPGGFPAQAVNGLVQFNEDVIINNFLAVNDTIDCTLIKLENTAFRTTVNDPAIVLNNNIPYPVSSRRTIRLERYIPPPGPPAPPPATFETQILQCVNVYKCQFVITNIPIEVEAVIPSLNNYAAYQYIGQAPVVANMPYFTSSITTAPVVGVPGSFTITVSASYYPPVLIPNAVPPPLPDYIFAVMAIDSNYW